MGSYTFTARDGEHLAGQTVILPPRSLLVVHGKGGRTRIVPLNSKALSIMEVLVNDAATGDYLFANREGEPFGSIKKGFQAACRRAKITNLRPYDLRHTFATRLQERYVPNSTISALLGHSRPIQGFGQESAKSLPNYLMRTTGGGVSLTTDRGVMNPISAALPRLIRIDESLFDWVAVAKARSHLL